MKYATVLNSKKIRELNKASKCDIVVIVYETNYN